MLKLILLFVFGISAVADTPPPKKDLLNNAYLKSRNFAGDGFVNLIKANASNKILLGPFEIPDDDGDPDECLKTNGSGVLSFAACITSPGGSNTYIQFNSSGSLGGSSDLTWDGSTLKSKAFTVTAAIPAAIASSASLDFDPSPQAGRLLIFGPDVSTRGQFQIVQARSDASAVINSLTIDTSGNATIYGSVSASGLTYPSSDGSAGECVKTNGSGVLSFGSCGGGGGGGLKIRKTTDSGQSLTNSGGNNTVIVFEDACSTFCYDNSGGAYNTSTGIFTAPATKCYEFHSTVTIDHAGETGPFMIDLVVNGTEMDRGQRINVVSGGSTGAHLSDVLCLTSGDAVSVNVRNETSGNVELEAYFASNFIQITELP